MAEASSSSSSSKRKRKRNKKKSVNTTEKLPPQPPSTKPKISPPTTIGVEEVDSNSDTYKSYIVTFFDDKINTLLTQTASIVDDWIAKVSTNHPNNKLIVGLDVEWRPSFQRNVVHAVAIIQLCVGHECLIFQFMYADKIPKSLVDFLNNPNYAFVGVGVEEDVKKILLDYDLRVANAVDLCHLAVQKLDKKELKNSGLKNLGEAVLGQELKKPKSVTMSKWDAQFLTNAQIRYACLDAFLSFKIGASLLSSSSSN